MAEQDARQVRISFDAQAQQAEATHAAVVGNLVQEGRQAVAAAQDEAVHARSQAASSDASLNATLVMARTFEQQVHHEAHEAVARSSEESQSAKQRIAELERQLVQSQADNMVLQGLSKASQVGFQPAERSRRPPKPKQDGAEHFRVHTPPRSRGPGPSSIQPISAEASPSNRSAASEQSPGADSYHEVVEALSGRQFQMEHRQAQFENESLSALAAISSQLATLASQTVRAGRQAKRSGLSPSRARSKTVARQPVSQSTTAAQAETTAARSSNPNPVAKPVSQAAKPPSSLKVAATPSAPMPAFPPGQGLTGLPPFPAVATGGSTGFCGTCGSPLHAASAFCWKCGTPKATALSALAKPKAEAKTQPVSQTDVEQMVKMACFSFFGGGKGGQTGQCSFSHSGPPGGGGPHQGDEPPGKSQGSRRRQRSPVVGGDGPDDPDEPESSNESEDYVEENGEEEELDDDEEVEVEPDNASAHGSHLSGSFCVNCGTSFPEGPGSNFCSVCGASQHNPTKACRLEPRLVDQLREVLVPLPAPQEKLRAIGP